MKAAIIGLGVIGKVHYEVLTKLGEEIVALCDIDEAKLALYDAPQKYLDFKQMLDDEDIDVVHICTPHYLHAEMVIYALDKGHNVLCEKPLCINMHQLTEILEAEKRAKGILGVCFQNRYNNSSKFIKEYLVGKKISSAEGVLRWRRDEKYYRSADWRGKWLTEGGGVLINQAIHTIDLLQWMLGFPTAVKAVVGNKSLKDVIEVEDTAECVFYGRTDFVVRATVTADRDYPVELRIVADDKKILVTPDGVTIDGKAIDTESDRTWYGKLSYGNGHEKLIADFYDCAATGRKFDIDGREGSKALTMVLASYFSHGKKVDIVF